MLTPVWGCPCSQHLSLAYYASHVSFTQYHFLHYIHHVCNHHYPPHCRHPSCSLSSSWRHASDRAVGIRVYYMLLVSDPLTTYSENMTISSCFVRVTHESLLSAWNLMYQKCIHTVAGRNPANQLISSLSHYLHGCIQPRWCRISSINSIISCAAKMLNRECSDGVGYPLRHLRTTDSSFGPCSCQGCDTCRRCCWASHAAHLTSLRP